MNFFISIIFYAFFILQFHLTPVQAMDSNAAAAKLLDEHELLGDPEMVDLSDDDRYFAQCSRELDLEAFLVGDVYTLEARDSELDAELAALFDQLELDRHEPDDYLMIDLSDDDENPLGGCMTDPESLKRSFIHVTHLHQMSGWRIKGGWRIKDGYDKFPPPYETSEFIREWLFRCDAGPLQDPESLVLAVEDTERLKVLLSVSNFSFNDTRLLPEKFDQLVLRVSSSRLRHRRVCDKSYHFDFENRHHRLLNYIKLTFLHGIALTEKTELLRFLDCFFQANRQSRGFYELDINRKTDCLALSSFGTHLEKATPLCIAVIKMSFPLVAWLLKHGADPNIKNWNGCTPLYYALGKYRNLDIARLLVKHGASILVDDEDRVSWLHIAAGLGKLRFVCRLVACGIDVNVVDRRNLTPLHHAWIHGQKRVVEWLLAHGADVNAADENGETLLHFAVHNKDRKGVEFLLRNGGDPRIPDNHGMTPTSLFRQSDF